MHDTNNSPQEESETVIVGGGISGLACALQLHKAQRPFTLITDCIGGRLATSDNGHYLGAVMMNNDYIHVKRHAKKSFSNRPWQSYIWDGSKGVNSLLRMELLKIPKLNKVFGEFNRAFRKLRAQAPYTCQKQLMEQDPLLRKLVSQTAVDFVREHQLESLAEKMLGPVSSAVFLCDWKKMSAFHFCIGISCTGNGVCNGDWSNTIDSLTQGYADQIVNDKVLQISELSGGKGYQVSCDSKQYRGRNVVLAVPGASGQALLDSLDASWNTNNQSNDAVEAISCHVFHITGKRRPLYRPKRSLLMGPTDDIKLFFPLPDGVDILYSSLAAPDFSRYYESHQIIAQRFWQPAIQLSKQSWRPLQPCSNFFTIGDHNICGLEDSYLTGLFAANRIIDKSNQAISA
jgi:hypothetical protein